MQENNSPSNLFYISGGGQNVVHLYISADIEEPHNYYPVYDLFRSAEPHQLIEVFINCNGGSACALTQILASMDDCEAHIRGRIECDCSSAATFNFRNCDSWHLSSYSKFMIHSDSSGMWGKRHEAIAQFEFSRNWLDSFLSQAYTPFLTAKEIQEMLSGKDFYFDAQEIGVRLQKVVKEREKIQKKMGV